MNTRILNNRLKLTFFIFLFLIGNTFLFCFSPVFPMHATQDYHGQTEPKEDEEKPKCENEIPECCPSEGSPVYLYNGEHFYTHIDLEIPGIIPITIRRHYSSFSLYNAEFGYGWINNYSYRLYRQHDGNLLLRRGCYDRDVFTNNGNKTFTESKYGFETITENLDGTYTLNRRDNQKYQFDINDCLHSIDDENGNQLIFTYTSQQMPVIGTSPYANITTPIVIGYTYRLLKIEQYRGSTPAGGYVELAYNDSGRITTITDSSGRQVSYLYDSNNNGNLIQFTDSEGNHYDYQYTNYLLTYLTDTECGACG